MKFDLDYIEKLVNILSKSDLTEITLEDVDKAIVLRKEKEIMTTAVPAATTIAPIQVSPSTITSQVITEPKQVEAPAKKGKPITAPVVGTFYQAPSPDSPPFISLGDTVSVGQVVCIIEAMKLMNEIESEVSGKIVEILVKDGEPVEYGQVLMYVE